MLGVQSADLQKTPSLWNILLNRQDILSVSRELKDLCRHMTQYIQHGFGERFYFLYKTWLWGFSHTNNTLGHFRN